MQNWNDVDEDGYWENYREEYEHGFRPRSEWDAMDAEPEYEEDWLFLDEEQEELEKKYGYPMDDLDEDDLLEIVEKFLKVKAESAKWDGSMIGIKYRAHIA